MKGSCPIKTAPQWTQSVETLGEDNTWKLWIDSPTGDILPPVKGAFYFFIEAKPRQAADLLNKHIPLSKKALLTTDNKKSLTEIISAADRRDRPGLQEIESPPGCGKFYIQRHLPVFLHLHCKPVEQR